jgi:ABC-2 type transport system ATP-binding protein
MSNVIETQNLTKKFGRFTAVDKINISVRKGEIYGFLGLNGAGKTTTIRMLLGMIGPSSGEARIDGKKVSAGSLDIWKSTGYLVEVPYSYPELSVRENLEAMRRLRAVADPKAVDSVMDRLALSQYSARKARTLSLGNSQRLGLAKALIHNPDILILDEPANGLDPAGIVEIRELLTDLAQNRGVTVFVSSHILGEVSKVATRIGIIHRGRLVREMDANELDRERKRRLLLGIRDPSAASHFLSQKGFTATPAENGFLEIFDSAAIDKPDSINSILVQAGIVPFMLKADEEDLESYFLRVVGSAGGAA